jgi:hypothetical protein
MPTLSRPHRSGFQLSATTARYCQWLFAVGIWLFLYAAFAPTADSAVRKMKEKVYQEIWCLREGGVLEARQIDKTRVDCLTQHHAIEFDFGNKWAEAIGQALHYALMTGRAPGIVLILERDSDVKYWNRMNAVIEKYQLNIKTWKMSPDDFL